MKDNLICNCDDDTKYFCPIHFGYKKYLDKKRIQKYKPVIHETVVLDEKTESRLVSHRAHMTKAEKTTFSLLVDLQVDFNFDWYIYPYYVDFILWNFGIVLELDGSFHEGREEYDDRRSKMLEDIGLCVYRIDNKDISKDRLIEILCEGIQKEKTEILSLIDNHNKKHIAN